MGGWGGEKPVGEGGGGSSGGGLCVYVEEVCVCVGRGVLVEGYQGAVYVCMWRRVVCVWGGGGGEWGGEMLVEGYNLT